MRAHTMIVFNCEECGFSLTVADNVETVTCRNCGKTTTVPEDDFDPMSETFPELPGLDSGGEELEG